MPTTPADIKNSYPLPVYSYRVTVNDTQMGFHEVSGLRASHATVTYRHGLSDWTGSTIVRGKAEPVSLTLRRGIIRSRGDLVDWFSSARSGLSGTAKRDVIIDLVDGNGEAVVRWTAQRAFPIALDAPTFNAEEQGIAIETLELVAHGLQMKYLTD